MKARERRIGFQISVGKYSLLWTEDGNENAKEKAESRNGGKLTGPPDLCTIAKETSIL